jgi:hypothetical protein
MIRVLTKLGTKVNIPFVWTLAAFTPMAMVLVLLTAFTLFTKGKTKFQPDLRTVPLLVTQDSPLGTKTRPCRSAKNGVR